MRKLFRYLLRPVRRWAFRWLRRIVLLILAILGLYFWLVPAPAREFISGFFF